MKKFFKFASYALLYVFVTFASAFGVVLLIPAPTSGNNDDLGQNQTTTIPAQLTEMLSRLSSANGLDVFLQADIASGEDNYSIVIDALVDLEDGFDSLSVDGNITVAINDDVFAIDIKYSEGTLYFDMFNGKFKIETANIMDSVSQVLKILDIEFPDLGIDLSQIDLDMIMGFLSNLTETKGDNSIAIKLNIPMLGELLIDCDLDYAISKVVLPQKQITNDTIISLTSEFDYPDNVELPSPEKEEYINISDLFLIAESVLGVLDQDEIGLSMNLGYEGQTFEGFLSANLKEFDSKLTINNILGYDVNLVAIDDIIYLEFGNINLKFDLNKSSLITSLLDKQFGIKVPLDEISQVLVAINSGKLFETIGGLFPQSGKVDLASIDLSIIESFSRDGDKLTFSLANIGEIACVIDGRDLREISFNGFGFDAGISIEEPREIGLEFDTSRYVNLEDIIPALDAIFTSIKYPTFTGGISIDVGGQNFYADYALSVDGDNRIVKLAATLLGQKFSLVADSENIFLQISELKVRFAYNEFDKIGKFIAKNFPSENGEELIDQILNEVKKLLNPEIHPDLITSIKDEDGSLIISVFGGSEIKFGYSDTLNSISFASENASVLLTINASSTPIEGLGIDTTEFITVEEILNVAQNAIDYVKAGKFYLDILAEYDGLNVVGSVNFDESGLEASIAIDYQGINGVVKFADKKIYIEIGENNVVFNLDDIDLVANFIEENFGVNVAEKINEVLGIMPFASVTGDELEIDSEIMANFDIEQIIRSLALGYKDNTLTLEVMGGKVEVKFDDYSISNIKANFENISVQICIRNQKAELNFDKDYADISKILPFAGVVKDYLTSKQFYLSASAEVFENGQSIYTTKDARIEFDITDGLKMYAAVKVEGRDSHSMEVFLHDGYLYANYNELLIKIDTADLSEILVILMNMFGIDPNLLPFLKDIAGNMDDFDFAAIKLPSVNAGDVSSVLGKLDGIRVDEHRLEIGLNMFGQKGLIVIERDGDKLVGIRLDNIGVSSKQKFNLAIDCLEFAGVQVPDESKNWVDISGSNELIKSVINLAEKKDFGLAGTLGVKAEVLGIPINMNVPFDVKIKLVDGKLEMMAKVGAIPSITFVNNDAPTGYNGSDRTAYIYLKDEFVYIHRTEKDGKYQKKVKVHYTEFLSDPMAYLQYIVGLSDSIMKEIDKAMELSRNRTTPIDVSKIIKEFNVSEDKKHFNVKLNLAELSNNPQLDYIGVGISVVESAEGKNIIGGISFEMHAPIASVFTVDLKSDDISLDVSKELDMSEMYEFVNSYTYGENEQWIIKDGKSSLAASKKYTIVLNENGGADVADIEAEVGAEITLPSFEDRVVDELETMTRNTYRFAGWFSDEALTKQFEEKVMPRFGATLYAKWNLIESLRISQLKFETNGGYAIDSVTLIEGQSFDLGSLNPTRYRDAVKIGYNGLKAKNEWRVTRYTFAGWYLDSNLSQKVEGSIDIKEDTTLYAKWNSEVLTEYYVTWKEPA